MKGEGKIFLVSGEVESGKSRFCRQAAAALKERGWGTAGLLSLAVFEGKRKVAIDALDLRNEVRRRLAELTEPESPREGIQTNRWRFSPGTIIWCNQVLEAAVPCDLLVVDELGPLEFERNEGLLSGFDAVDSRLYRVSLTVVRPSLLENAIERWPAAETLTIKRLSDTSKIVRDWVERI